jgi:RHS repeat-associated protein
MDEFMSRSEIVVSGGTTTTTNRHFLTNHLGSVLALTDAAGAITKNYKYEPYGKVTTTGETSANPYQYTGRENDIAASGTNPTGLYFYRARYYDASAQRFISEDPIGLSGGLNVHRYSRNSPVRYLDPTGKAPKINCSGLSSLQCGLAYYCGVSGMLNGGGANDASDAMRHCTWSCCMTENLGEAVAKAIGDRHESDSPGPDNQMDLCNNDIGRKCGLSGSKRSCRSCCASSPLQNGLNEPCPPPPSCT